MFIILSMPEIYTLPEPFMLESGRKIEKLSLAYTTWGKLNDSLDNVVWVFHALTANSDPAEWWDGLVGEGKYFDPADFFIVCVNMPGSCYGSTGPLDVDHTNGMAYMHNFPMFTTRDMVRAYIKLRNHLGIKEIYIGIGGSMGGQQLLEWAIEEPALFKHIIPIATNAFHSPWAIAFNATQRMCIENDPTWNTNGITAGKTGMQTARAVALISYRNYYTYNINQKGISPSTENSPVDKMVFKAETYQRYQGEKLSKRFNAFSYYFLGKSMDAHNVGRGRNSVESALEKITARTLVIGIKSDILFPVSEQVYLAKNIPGAVYTEIDSFYGHDGFLLEYEKISQQIGSFLF